MRNGMSVGVSMQVQQNASASGQTGGTAFEELEDYLKELRDNPSKAEVLKRVKEGLMVDEYR